jgi:RNase P subunit RPR2
MKSPMSPGVGLLRNTFSRLSFRSSNQSPRPGMTRSKTMGREEIEKVKVMKLSLTPKQVVPTPQVVNVARPQLTRSNTMGAGEIERLRNLRLPQGTSCTVCKDCRQMLTHKVEAMKRGESVEHRTLMVLGNIFY